jgi:hypothetical protein
LAGLESARMFAREPSEWKQRLEPYQVPTLNDPEGLGLSSPKATTTNPKDLLGDKKVDFNQISPFATAHEACAMMDGTWKYGYRNWREKEVRARVYVAAAKRHLDAWAEGEESAGDSGVHHLGHARACLGILLDAQETGNLVDDRVKSKGQFSYLMNRLSDWVVKRRQHYHVIDPAPESGVTSRFNNIT